MVAVNKPEKKVVKQEKKPAAKPDKAKAAKKDVSKAAKKVDVKGKKGDKIKRAAGAKVTKGKKGAKKGKSNKTKEIVKRHRRNPILSASTELRRYSKTRVYKRRCIYKLKEKPPTPKPVKIKSPKFLTKTIGGEKNGETRKVRVCRLPRHLPTQVAKRKLQNTKKPFSQHKRRLRASIRPGTVLILVAGRHRGKRVVFLKQLGTGLLLVTGPFALNGCPLRRVNQIYTIATKTRLKIKPVKIPSRINDDYFRRKSLKNLKHREGELFDTAKEEYTLSNERKEDQLAVDKQILKVIKASKEKKSLKGYLETMFALKNKMYPHKMLF